MVFIATRMILVLGGMFCSLVLLRRRKIRNCGLYAVAIGGALCLFSMMPFENAFMTFSNPKDAVEYWIGERAVAFVEGEQNTLVITKNGNDMNSRIIPKTKMGWKLPWLDLVELTIVSMAGGVPISVWHVKGSTDYFIEVNKTVLIESLEISDSVGSNFIVVKNEKNYLDEGGAKAQSWRYIACVKNFNTDYRIQINGKSHNLEPIG